MVVEIGRLCVKLAGRDAGKECLIVDVIDDNFVTIEGNTRRRKCNILHLEFLPQVAKIKKDATHAEVSKALEKLGYKVEAKIAKKKTAKKIEAPKKTLKEKVAAKVKKADKK